MKQYSIQPQGQLGILLLRPGDVVKILVAGVETILKGVAQPIGLFTQLDNIPLGRLMDNKRPRIKDFVPLATLNKLIFGEWTSSPDNVYALASDTNMLELELLNVDRIKLKDIVPINVVFNKRTIKNRVGTHAKQTTSF